MFRAVVSFVALSAIAGIAASDALAQATTGRLKAIAASKTIKIAYRTDAAPFSFVNERNEITGYTIELCKMIVASLQQQLGGRPIAIQVGSSHVSEPLRCHSGWQGRPRVRIE